MLQVSKLLKIGLQPLQACQKLLLFALQRLHGLFWEPENALQRLLRVHNQPFMGYLPSRRRLAMTHRHGRNINAHPTR